MCYFSNLLRVDILTGTMKSLGRTLLVNLSICPCSHPFVCQSVTTLRSRALLILRLVLNHAALNSCHFLTCDWSCSFHVFANKPMIGLGDNDWCCAGVVCEVPKGSGWMMQSKAMQSEVFDIIICLETDGASQTMPKHSGHYSNYNTKRANSQYFHWKLCRWTWRHGHLKHCHFLHT